MARAAKNTGRNTLFDLAACWLFAGLVFLWVLGFFVCLFVCFNKEPVHR